MIKSSELYNDFTLDDANKDQNGSITYTQFNRNLWRAQLSLLNWLTGNPDDATPPEKISPQKARELVAKFIKKYPVQVSNGQIERPSDYYLFRDLYSITGEELECFDKYEEDTLRIVKKPIELLDNSKFTTRCATFIKRLKPEVKPIAKLSTSGNFEFEPQDIGSVVLEYYRLPAKAAIVTELDTTYNEPVPDEALTVNLEWDEGARGYLIYYLNEMFSKHVREQGFQQQNAAAKQ